ncbi:MAG TPA: FkbM family methyltransferase [Pirellulaceae bacterium]|nr:FkbM family methyltransferase [Pirellulaceae bacterium]
MGQDQSLDGFLAGGPLLAGQAELCRRRRFGYDIRMLLPSAVIRGAWSRKGPAGRLLAACELKRIKRLPRYRPFRTRLLGPWLQGVDGPSFYYAFREIFEKRNYEFTCTSAAPRIIDGGANIGLSVLFFKQLFPAARIVAFEPDATVFAALAENVLSFDLHDVELVNQALWVRDQRLTFYSEGADAGRLRCAHERGVSVQVQACRLRDYLAEPLDMLKLDIEGAEVDVLLDCADRLDGVQSLYVEYHSFAGQPQRLDELLAILRNAGFRIQIHTQFASHRPLVSRATTLGMDFQADVCAYRE